MNKTIKKLTCFVLTLSLLGGMYFVDMAKATTYPTKFFYQWFEPQYQEQYVTVQANCDNYYGGYYYATAFCDAFANSFNTSPNVTVFAPSKKRFSNLDNYGTLTATVLGEDDYDMRYMSSSVYNGAYVEFKVSLHLMGTPMFTISIAVRG